MSQFARLEPANPSTGHPRPLPYRCVQMGPWSARLHWPDPRRHCSCWNRLMPLPLGHERIDNPRRWHLDR
jgi:hypothetical protein